MSWTLRPGLLGCSLDLRDPSAPHACNCPHCSGQPYTDEFRIKRLETLLERIWQASERTPSGCLIYTAGRSVRGYRVTSCWDPSEKRDRRVSVHRAVYELVIGPLEEGLQIDHLCHTNDCPGGSADLHRACVEPSHLAQVTNLQNTQRRTVRPAHPEGPAHGTMTRAMSPYLCKCDECRACANAYAREWRKKNADKVREQKARWKARQAERAAS